mgnify:CR=1 FL=1
MPSDLYLHERSDFSDLIRVVASKRNLLPVLVEKTTGSCTACAVWADKDSALN